MDRRDDVGPYLILALFVFLIGCILPKGSFRAIGILLWPVIIIIMLLKNRKAK